MFCFPTGHFPRIEQCYYSEEKYTTGTTHAHTHMKLTINAGGTMTGTVGSFPEFNRNITYK